MISRCFGKGVSDGGQPIFYRVLASADVADPDVLDHMLDQGLVRAVAYTFDRPDGETVVVAATFTRITPDGVDSIDPPVPPMLLPIDEDEFERARVAGWQ